MKRFAIVLASIFSVSINAYAACPAGTVTRTDRVEGKPACTLRGNHLNTTLALNSRYAYVMEGIVRIGGDNRQNSTITLEAGTKVYGAPGSVLVIMRGSKIMATGQAGNPVLFTSLQRTDLKPGLWGGIIINGNARINDCRNNGPFCEAASEGFVTDAPKFGGNNDADNSGRLKYVRVEYGGYEVAPNNEVNGITFNGVGNGTEVEYIQVHKNADDGIEFFGGTVNVKHVLLTDNDDDGFDWDMGWRGMAQFVMIEVANGTEDVNGIEADNFKHGMNNEPRSNPILSNVTIVAKGSNSRLFNGILLRNGTAGQIHNAIVTGDFKTACINIDNADTFNNAGVVTPNGVAQTGLKMVNSIVDCADGKNFEDKGDDPFAVSAWFRSENKSANLLVSPRLLNGRLPAENSPAVGAGVTPRLPFFTPVDFIGAFSPYADEDWTTGWTAK